MRSAAPEPSAPGRSRSTGRAARRDLEGAPTAAPPAPKITRGPNDGSVTTPASNSVPAGAMPCTTNPSSLSPSLSSIAAPAAMTACSSARESASAPISVLCRMALPMPLRATGKPIFAAAPVASSRSATIAVSTRGKPAAAATATRVGMSSQPPSGNFRRIADRDRSHGEGSNNGSGTDASTVCSQSDRLAMCARRVQPTPEIDTSEPSGRRVVPSRCPPERSRAWSCRVGWMPPCRSRPAWNGLDSGAEARRWPAPRRSRGLEHHLQRLFELPPVRRRRHSTGFAVDATAGRMLARMARGRPVQARAIRELQRRLRRVPPDRRRSRRWRGVVRVAPVGWRMPASCRTTPPTCRPRVTRRATTRARRHRRKSSTLPSATSLRRVRYGRSGFHRDDRLGLRHSGRYPDELSWVAERLEVERNDGRRDVDLPVAQQVVAGDVGLVANRDETRDPDAAAAVSSIREIPSAPDCVMNATLPGIGIDAAQRWRSSEPGGRCSPGPCSWAR